MSIYEELGLKPFINASEPYTRNGGSVMSRQVIEAMAEAAECFVDMGTLICRVAERAAQLSGNDGAFVTSGAGAGVALSAAALLCEANKNEAELLDVLPDTTNVQKNEILIFRGKYLDIIQYWKLIRVSGARLVLVDPTKEAMLEAVNERTAGVFLFPAPMYEEGIPACEEIIPVLKEKGILVAVDAAAQLPPASNLYYYTRKLGADLAVFSGGKHIKGPQSTGLIVGNRTLTGYCQKLACPNPRLGRAFKVGKEELAGFIKALELFVNESADERYQRQRERLERIQNNLAGISDIRMELWEKGRLGTEQPLLLVDLPGEKTGEECCRFTRAYQNPVDVGYFKKENGRPGSIFINAYLLKDGEEDAVADAVRAYLEQ